MLGNPGGGGERNGAVRDTLRRPGVAEYHGRLAPRERYAEECRGGAPPGGAGRAQAERAPRRGGESAAAAHRAADAADRARRRRRGLVVHVARTYLAPAAVVLRGTAGLALLVAVSTA